MLFSLSLTSLLHLIRLRSLFRRKRNSWSLCIGCVSIPLTRIYLSDASSSSNLKAKRALFWGATGTFACKLHVEKTWRLPKLWNLIFEAWNCICTNQEEFFSRRSALFALQTFVDANFLKIFFASSYQKLASGCFFRFSNSRAFSILQDWLVSVEKVPDSSLFYCILYCFSFLRAFLACCHGISCAIFICWGMGRVVDVHTAGSFSSWCFCALRVLIHREGRNASIKTHNDSALSPLFNSTYSSSSAIHHLCNLLFTFLLLFCFVFDFIFYFIFYFISGSISCFVFMPSPSSVLSVVIHLFIFTFLLCSRFFVCDFLCAESTWCHDTGWCWF